MDILEFAMQMEKDGEKYYRELAGKCGAKGLETIFTMLADSEVAHYNTLKEMAGKMDAQPVDTKILGGVKNVFVQMKEDGDTFDFNDSQLDNYRKAQEIEKKAEAFYLEKAGAVETEAQKNIFKSLAIEERQHVQVLGSIIDFVSKPDSWLENAEWHHLNEY